MSQAGRLEGRQADLAKCMAALCICPASLTVSAVRGDTSCRASALCNFRQVFGGRSDEYEVSPLSAGRSLTERGRSCFFALSLFQWITLNIKRF